MGGAIFRLILVGARRLVTAGLCSDSNVMAQYKGAASEGTRAANLMKKREKQREELERRKQKISEVY